MSTITETKMTGNPAMTGEAWLKKLGDVASAEYAKAKKRKRADNAARNAADEERQELRDEIEKAGIAATIHNDDGDFNTAEAKRNRATLEGLQTQLKEIVSPPVTSRLKLFDEFLNTQAGQFFREKFAPMNTTDERPDGCKDDKAALDYRVTELQKNRLQVQILENQPVSRDEMESNIDNAVYQLRENAPVILSEKDGRVVWPMHIVVVGERTKDAIDHAAVMADIFGDEMATRLKARLTTPPGGGMQQSGRQAKALELAQAADLIRYQVAWWIRRIEEKGEFVDVRWPGMRAEHYLDIKRVR
jgi:hypothetical protein